MNTGVGACLLIDCIAPMPSALGSRRSAGITNDEKAKNTPPARPDPTAAIVAKPVMLRSVCVMPPLNTRQLR